MIYTIKLKFNEGAHLKPHERKKYFKDITADQVKSVDNDILREQRPEMPVNIDRQSRVSFGGSRKK